MGASMKRVSSRDSRKLGIGGGNGAKVVGGEKRGLAQSQTNQARRK